MKGFNINIKYITPDLQVRDLNVTQKQRKRGDFFLVKIFTLQLFFLPIKNEHCPKFQCFAALVASTKPYNCVK